MELAFSTLMRICSSTRNCWSSTAWAGIEALPVSASAVRIDSSPEEGHAVSPLKTDPLPCDKTTATVASTRNKLRTIQMGVHDIRGAACERMLGPEDAIDRLDRKFRERRINHSVEWILRSPVRDTGVSVNHITLHRSGYCVGTGTGKGVGPQALASGMYEAFEHEVALSGGPELEWWKEFVRPTANASAAAWQRDAVLASMLRDGSPPTVFPTVPFAPIQRVMASTPQPFDPGVYLPAALVDLSYGPSDDKRERLPSGYRSSNGIAAGSCKEEAVLHALNEVIERDAVAAFLLDLLLDRPHGWDLDLNNELGRLKRQTEIELGVSISVRMLDCEWGTAILALSDRFDGRGCRITGAGASHNAAYAVERAVAEVAQQIVVSERWTPGDDGWPDDLTRLRRFPLLCKAASLKELPPACGSKSVPLVTTPHLADQIASILSRLAAANISAYCRPLYATAPDATEPQVWQVVAPGLENFYLVRYGMPVELTGRLRSAQALEAVRRTMTTDR